MKIDVEHNLPELASQMRKAPDVIMRHVDLAVQRAAIEGSRAAKDAAPKFLSTLANSIGTQKLGQGSHRIIARANYARHVEEGAGPGGAPPIEALRRWIRLKGITGRAATSERDLAFLIQRKIRRRGTPAQPFMGPQVESTQDRLLQLLPRAIQAGAEEAFG